MAREGWKFLPVMSLLPQLKWQHRQTLRLNKVSLAAWQLPCHTLTAMPTARRLWLNRTHPIPIGYNYNHSLHLYMSEGLCLWVCVSMKWGFISAQWKALVGSVPGCPNFRIEKSLFNTRCSSAVIWFLTVIFYSLFSHPSGTCLCLQYVLACILCCGFV